MVFPAARPRDQPTADVHDDGADHPARSGCPGWATVIRLVGKDRVARRPFGPSRYVLEQPGVLTAYSLTTGDGELGEYCDAAWSAPTISLADALEATGR
jgi:hypothetical protein